MRINRPLELCVPDIAAAVMPAVGTLILPKVMGPEHIRLLSEVVAVREAAQGMAPRPYALRRGGRDARCAAATAPPSPAPIRAWWRSAWGRRISPPNWKPCRVRDLLYHFGMMVVAAARAARIQPMGSVGPFADFSDLDGYRASLKRSRALGFACQACIHPAQVAIINEEYGPSPAEADRARRLIAAFDAALAEGKGAVAFEGQMIDLPVVERARRLLARVR